VFTAIEFNADDGRPVSTHVPPTSAPELAEHTELYYLV
jgi:hypothetical protein